MRHFPAGAALIAVALVVPSTATPASAIGAPPPVTWLQVRPIDGSHLSVFWKAPPLKGAGAVVCHAMGTTPPTSPTGATCTGVLMAGEDRTYTRTTIGPFPGLKRAISVSVFSRLATGEFGPAMSATVTLVNAAPQAPSVTTKAVSATSLKVTWQRLESASMDNDVDRAELRVTAGPSADAAATPATTSRKADDSFVVTGLKEGATYSFAVRLRDAAGQWGVAGKRLASTRMAGTYVIRSTTGFADDRAPIASSTERPPAVLASADGTMRVLAPTKSGLVYTERTVTGAWSAPVTLSSGPGFNARLAESPKGALVAMWLSGYRVRAAGATEWGPVRRTGLIATDVVIDKRGALHFVGRDMDYRSNAGGAWHSQVLRSAEPGSLTPSAAAIAYDARTDEVVVALKTDTQSLDAYGDMIPATVFVTRAKATARSLPRPVRVLRLPSGSFDMCPLSSQPSSRPQCSPEPRVAAYGGRITVAVEQRERAGAPGGMYLATGLSPATVGAWQQVPTTTSADWVPVMTSYATGRIALSWFRSTPTWDVRQQGVWVGTFAFSTGTRRWTAGPVNHATTSAYDTPLTASRDANGHLSTAAVRTDRDVDFGAAS